MVTTTIRCVEKLYIGSKQTDFFGDAKERGSSSAEVPIAGAPAESLSAAYRFGFLIHHELPISSPLLPAPGSRGACPELFGIVVVPVTRGHPPKTELVGKR